MSDPRQAAQTRRRHEMDRLALLTLERRSLCCCTRCGQLDRAEELRVLIRVSQERVAELTESCCQRLETTCSPDATEAAEGGANYAHASSAHQTCAGSVASQEPTASTT